jgi:hypothetical protein
VRLVGWCALMVSASAAAGAQPAPSEYRISETVRVAVGRTDITLYQAFPCGVSVNAARLADLNPQHVRIFSSPFGKQAHAITAACSNGACVSYEYEPTCPDLKSSTSTSDQLVIRLASEEDARTLAAQLGTAVGAPSSMSYQPSAACTGPVTFRVIDSIENTPVPGFVSVWALPGAPLPRMPSFATNVTAPLPVSLPCGRYKYGASARGYVATTSNSSFTDGEFDVKPEGVELVLGFRKDPNAQ